MGWPTQYWNPRTGSIETFNVNVPTSPRGFPDNWQDYSAGATPFWGIKDNPLWQAAAEANGMDFDLLVSRLESELGTEEDWADMQPVDTGTGNEFADSLPTAIGNPFGNGSENTTEQYDSYAFELAMEEWRNDGNNNNSMLVLLGADIGQPELTDFPINAINKYGFTNYGHHDLADKLGQLDDWMTNSIKTFKESDYDIIAAGPSGLDYGFDQEDIFAALGLNEAPEAPKALEVSYDMKLDDARPSYKVYNTPEGYPEVNLQED